METTQKNPEGRLSFLSTNFKIVNSLRENKSFNLKNLQYQIVFDKYLYVSHYAKIQKYEQGKIGLQFFDMWC